MADRTAIAWTDHTLNPWMGCFKVSQGCTHCYAETLTVDRLRVDVFGFDTSKRRRTKPKTWNAAYRWNTEAMTVRTPTRVFCASLADVFEDAPGPNEWRPELWQLIHDTPWCDWQILTKRPENISRMLPDTWADNIWGCWPHVWLGTSIEDNRVAQRSVILTEVPAFNHFISYEPAIGPGDEIPLEGIEWMIVGGESGPGYRKLDPMWPLDMLVRCQSAGVAYFFKQDSGPRTEMRPNLLGQIIREYPASWDRRARLAA